MSKSEMKQSFFFSSFEDIGADILDSTNQNVFSFGILEEQDTWWELCPEQRDYFEYTQHLNAYLREEYHSLNVRSQSCIQIYPKSKIIISIDYFCIRI